MKIPFNKKNIIILVIFIILIGSAFIKVNFFKFYSIYFEYKYKITKNIIKKQNLKKLETIKNNKIIFDKEEYNFIKFPLSDYGVKYKKKYVHRPIGYFDIYNNRIIFVSYDGSIYYSNNINEIKKNKLVLKKIKILNYDFNFDDDDDNFYRNIVIRDILVDKENLYIVTNGRSKLNNDYYGLTKILYGKINLDVSEISLKEFFNSEVKIFNIKDWSHTGGRMVKYKDSSFLLTVPDHALMDDYKKLESLINSDKSVIGKILLIKNGKFSTFSYGHRNPQGLYYDSENDLIFETEHGPTGGDEINLIKNKKNYGWPSTTYGAHINGLNKYRNHDKNGFIEPLKYWWPRNCAMSEIIKIDNNFNSNWKDEYTLMNACLSGSYNQGESLYRWKFDKKKEKLIKRGKYFIGDRIRDLKYSKKNKVLIILLENQKQIALIY